MTKDKGKRPTRGAAGEGEGAGRGRQAPRPTPRQAPRETPPRTAPPVERRREPRAPVNIRIDYQTVDAFFSEFASNINQGGLYIKTAKPLPPGTPLKIQFLLPNKGRPVQVTGEVVWVNEKTTKGINPGMGIRFEDLDAEAKAEINDLVRALRNA
jgi:type IV pilus assembly protein PilZ